MTKRCGWCNQDKPVSEFARMVNSDDGRQPACRDCYADNWRDLHNIDEAPPRRRRSPYDNMATVFSQIEQEIVAGRPTLALGVIATARQEYSL